MVVKHIQICGVHLSQKCICKTEKKIESRPFYYSQAKLTPRSLSPFPGQRKTTHSPHLRGWNMRTYFKMYCFKSAFTPTTLYFFSTFLINIISLRLLVPADFKSFQEFKINSYYSLNTTSQHQLFNIFNANVSAPSQTFNISNALRIVKLKPYVCLCLLLKPF